MEWLSGALIAQFLGVLLIDLILSGDNAVVIALAVRNLEGGTRRKAIFWGALGAVALRLAFAAVITYLLQIPLLQAAAALLLVWIAWRLLFQEGDHGNVRAGAGVLQAVRIIIVADVIMSLDNVVALVGVSGGNFVLLVFGLLLTIPLIVYGSQLLSALMDRLPGLIYLGSGILIYVAVEMFLGDRIIHGLLENSFVLSLEKVVAVVLAAAFIAFGYYRASRTPRHPAPRVR